MLGPPGGQGGGGGGQGGGWPPQGARRHMVAMQGHLAAAGILAMPAAVHQAFPPPPPPTPEPAGLRDGGRINMSGTPLLFDHGTTVAPTGRGGGKEYDKYVINQQPEPYSLIAPSEDVLLWATRAGQELTVVNTRLQVVTAHHQLKLSPQSVGIVLSEKCVMYTNDCGFVFVWSQVDKSFRLVHEYELRISINGQPLAPSFGPVRANRGRVLAGRATYKLDDGDTIVHLLADPALALYFKISQIQKCLLDKDTTITPLEMVNLTTLPSQLAGRTDPLESAIMLLGDRILLGGPILNTTHLEWAWFDVHKKVVKNERVFDGPHGAPRLHQSFLLKIRLNPLNQREILVHILNPYTAGDDGRHGKGELWVMGMSTKMTTFQWKRRERPPAPDDPAYRQIMQTPFDCTRSPEGVLYVRWCDFEGLGPGEEYLCDFRHCRSFILTRVERSVPPLSSIAARVLQGFEQLSFPQPRLVLTEQPDQLPPVRHPLMCRESRRRAAVTGVTTSRDFMRYVTAHFICNTSHVYFDGEMVYDDTEELIEQQRKAINRMTRGTPFRSLFGTLFSQATNKQNPVSPPTNAVLPAVPMRPANANPNVGGANPNPGGANPNVGGANPNAGGANPNAGGANPNAGGANQNVGGANPNAGGANPNEGGANPNVGGANPNMGGANGNVGGANRNVGGANGNVGGARGDRQQNPAAAAFDEEDDQPGPSNRRMQAVAWQVRPRRSPPRRTPEEWAEELRRGGGGGGRDGDGDGVRVRGAGRAGRVRQPVDPNRWVGDRILATDRVMEIARANPGVAYNRLPEAEQAEIAAVARAEAMAIAAADEAAVAAIAAAAAEEEEQPGMLAGGDEDAAEL